MPSRARTSARFFRLLIKARDAPDLATLNGEITNATLKKIIRALPSFIGHKEFPAAAPPAAVSATSASSTARPLQLDPGS